MLGPLLEACEIFQVLPWLDQGRLVQLNIPRLISQGHQAHAGLNAGPAPPGHNYQVSASTARRAATAGLPLASQAAAKAMAGAGKGPVTARPAEPVTLESWMRGKEAGGQLRGFQGEAQLRTLGSAWKEGCSDVEVAGLKALILSLMGRTQGQGCLPAHACLLSEAGEACLSRLQGAWSLTAYKMPHLQ
jgi:hypothetical protein